MSNKKSKVNNCLFEFYGNYCASKNTCIVLITFSSVYILLCCFCNSFPRPNEFTNIASVIWLLGIFVLTIFYSIFYSKVVYYTKRFKIQKELAIIFKMSTTILVFIWICFCFNFICMELPNITIPLLKHYSDTCSKALFILLLIIVISLLLLSSVGLWTYIKYGKKYEIFSEYKLIKKEIRKCN